MADERYEIEIGIKTEGTEQSERKLNTMEKLIQKTEKRAKILNKLKVSPAIRIQDKISGSISKIETKLKSLGNKTVSVTVKAKDMASSAISKISSPVGALATAAGAYGIGKLTLGSSMDYEAQMVSMEHWLKGNKKLAQEAVSWLDNFGAKTPFETEDLFPAMSRAIGLSDGDLTKSEKLVEVAADMAGLSPGKTVQDAMEALADAQMGEFERLKEFNMKMTQDEMKKLGSYDNFISKVESKFGGGAEKLSQTAKGRLSTIVDNIKILFRKAGDGMLVAIKPRLEKMTQWFEKNPAKVKEWKDKLQRLGQETFEGLLSAGERVLKKLEDKFNDPQFQSLTWSQKLGVLLEDVTSYVTPKAIELGGKLGYEIGKNIVSGVEAALDEHPIIRTILYAYVGGRIAGPTGSIIMTGAGIGEGAGKAVGNKIEEVAKERESERAQRIKNAGKVIDDAKKGEVYYPNTSISAKAAGDIVSRPIFSLIGEDGPEAIIPLSSKRRSRGIDLWEEAGRMLGVRTYATGGFAGTVPAGAGAGNGDITVYSSNTVNWGSDIDEDALAMKIGRKIVRDIKQVYQNRP